jgi:4-diphosphocytidyl-2-C-methyl-D-erythritol kinase
MPLLSMKSCAKVNLGLRIVGKRNDGYHDIETILQTIDLSDEIEIDETSGGIEVVCNTPGVPRGQENLAFAAAKMTLEAARSSRGVSIKIDKKIPSGGGLGGASSNAAATIKGLNSLFDLGLDEEKMYEIAKALGSDVPFFIRGGAALATGRGDRLKHIDVKRKLNLVIVFPGFPVSTGWAYEKANSGLTPPDFDIKILASALEQGDTSSLCKRLYNSFEEVVFGHYPELLDMKKMMLQLGASGALLSGSGSCVFCIVEERDSARAIASQFSKEGLATWETTTC